MIYHKKSMRLLSAVLALCLFVLQPLSAKADLLEDRIAEHRALPIQSNEIAGWPQGPVVSAESAILIEAETGTILYSKNIHKKQYPASTTKILTALLTYENCSMDEIITFSHDDVFGIPRNSNHIAMNVGDTLSVDLCLNALLIRSANEVAYALAAHIGGSWEKFAEMMNQRARELGAVDSNFVNPNGLPDEAHVTSAYDLAMIGRAFFANETLCKITLSPKLVVPKKKEDLVEWNQMGLIPTGKYAYEYLVGCKTGYTDSARSTLVSCAEKNGLRLICVVLNDENPEHNKDTVALFEYGFNNFDKINVSQSETRYDIDNIGFFYNAPGIFVSRDPILSLNREDCVIIPKLASFDDLESSISYETDDPEQAAKITYTYRGVPVGCVSLDFAALSRTNLTFDEKIPSGTADPMTSASPEDSVSPEESAPPSFIFISPLLLKILLGIVLTAGALFGIFVFLQRNFHFSFKAKLIPWRRHDFRPRDRMSSREIHRDHRAQIRAAKRRARERYKRRR